MTRHRIQSALVPYVLLVPAALLLLVLAVPIAQTAVNAFCELDRYGNRAGWAGLENFRRTLADGDFRRALANTVVWTAVVVLATLALSLPVSLLLNRRFVTGRIARWALVVPWATSLAISALVWRYIFDGEVGPANAFLASVGLESWTRSWLALRVTSFPAMMAVAVFVSIPFTSFVLLAGLQGIPGELYEAARVDGAGRFWCLTAVTLPLLRRSIAIATVVNIINVFNSFPIVWTMTGGGPANTTDIATTFLYRRAFTDNQFGAASAQSLIVFALLLSFSLAYGLLFLRRDEEAAR